MFEQISLKEAAKLVPGATKETLLRRARLGHLVVYRVGREYTTALDDLTRCVELCRVKPSNPQPMSRPVDAESASRALDAALAEVREVAKRRKLEEKKNRS